MIYFYGYEDWIDFKYIPFVVYAVINATVLVAAICLYIGIFRVRKRNKSLASQSTVFQFYNSQLSNVWTIIGLLLLLFVLHGLFAMLLIIYTRGGEKQRQARLLSPKAPYPESTLRTGLFLGLWLCIFAIDRLYLGSSTYMPSCSSHSSLVIRFHTNDFLFYHNARF